jgi:mono/diheme cytochrome c family protein
MAAWQWHQQGKKGAPWALGYNNVAAEGGSGLDGRTMKCLHRPCFVWLGVLVMSASHLLWAQAAAPAAGASSATQPPVLELHLTNRLNWPSITNVRIPFDVVYGREKNYKGIGFYEALTNMIHPSVSLPEDGVVVFLCNDGYNPAVPLKTLIREHAFIAVADLDAPKGSDWLPIKSGASKQPGPLYLVWPESSATSSAHPWPYGVVGIRIASRQSMFGPAMPLLQAHQRGFELYSKSCMTCHGINGVGGTLGPDLNYPKNVYEYWQPAQLMSYVQDPSKFRLNAKMPSFEALGKENIVAILEYVKHMQGHKVAPRLPVKGD